MHVEIIDEGAAPQHSKGGAENWLHIIVDALSCRRESPEYTKAQRLIETSIVSCAEFDERRRDVAYEIANTEEILTVKRSGIFGAGWFAFQLMVANPAWQPVGSAIRSWNLSRDAVEDLFGITAPAVFGRAEKPMIVSLEPLSDHL